MTDFLTGSACHGHKPKSLGIARQFSRGELLSKMIRQRNAVRFLIAPPMFGKSALAAEYAESIFSFENVFWIQCKSPCFLRDLDKGIIVSTLMKTGEKPSLVVFDNIPLLDERRADALSRVFDQLLSHAWEILVTMTPRCDVFEDRQPDGVRIRARDLLLSDSEIDAERSDAERIQRPASSLISSERIPGLFWGDNSANERFLQAIVKEELAVDELLTIFTMLILEKGRLADVSLFVKGWDAGLLEGLQADYVYLGIDAYREEFAASVFPLELLVKAFMPRLDAMATHSNHQEKNSLVLRLADLLLGSHNPARACNLVTCMCPPRQRIGWLEDRSENLLLEGCILPAHQVFESIRVSSVSPGMKLSIFEAWRLLLLGDETKALRIASRLYLMTEASYEVRALAALMVFRNGNKGQNQKALAVLEALVRFDVHSLERWEDPKTAQPFIDNEPYWKVLVVGQLCLHYSRNTLLEFLEITRFDRSMRFIQALFFIWFLDDVQDGSKRSKGKEGDNEPLAYVPCICTFLERRKQDGDVDLLDAILYARLERYCTAFSPESVALIPRVIRSAVSDKEVSIFSQRSAYKRILRETDIKKSDFRRTHPDELRSDARETNHGELVPVLEVKLLGGLEVKIGGQIIDPRLFSRRKIKILLTLLVINQGKEFPRERLCKILWPESTALASQRNLYSIWSQLKKALTTQQGTCPYLIHTQFSYKLDGHYIASDIAEFETLCRKLLFGLPNLSEWAQAFVQMDDLYTDDLLPTETENKYIIQARNQYRTRLVDAFSSAALRLFETGEYQEALWFARAALARDASREDVYTVLMQAQIALGQRAAALETYFKCRRYLVEELGIDPSEKTTMLYSSIIAEEPGFKTRDFSGTARKGELSF